MPHRAAELLWHSDLYAFLTECHEGDDTIFFQSGNKEHYKFDEIVTNMPVKGKKAKEDMDAFYARFFEKSKSLLAEDGIIIMYSNEVGFVKKQLRLQPCYRLIQEYTIRKKDSYCLFIIGMK